MSTQRERGVEEGSIPLTSAYRLLSHVYRRALVDSLDQREAGIALADAASEVASRNLERSVTESSPEEIEEIYAALYHSHVPKLVEADVVAHDRDRNVVSLTERGRELAAIQDDIVADADGEAAGSDR